MLRRLLQAAERGEAEAQFNLAMLYHTGDAIGGRTAAIRWLREAAEHGLPRAQAMLAELFAEEPEEGCNRVEACFWFLVAEKGLSGIISRSATASPHRTDRNWYPRRQ